MECLGCILRFSGFSVHTGSHHPVQVALHHCMFPQHSNISNSRHSNPVSENVVARRPLHTAAQSRRV